MQLAETGGRDVTYIVNVKDIIAAVILCSLAVATLVLFAVAVIGEKIRKYKEDCKNDKSGASRS